MKLWTTLLAVFLIVLALGCHAADSGAPGDILVNPAGTWYRADQQLTTAAFGQVTRAAAGSLLDLAVPENASTGFSWRCQIPAKGIILVRTALVGPDSMLPGSGGMRHFLFLVNQPGKPQVALQYGQWWKGGERQPIQKLAIDAVVSPSH